MTQPPRLMNCRSRVELSQVTLIAAGLALLSLTAIPAQAQTTRAEEIDMARRDKQVRSWPERESPIVRQANELIERGFKEGVEDRIRRQWPSGRARRNALGTRIFVRRRVPQDRHLARADRCSHDSQDDDQQRIHG